MAERDLAVDENGAMIIRNGDFVVTDALTDDVALLMVTNQGEMKMDPLAGCNLIQRMNGRTTRSGLERILRIQMERDGKDWTTITAGINVRTNG